jgi:hypothetical protein
MNGKLVITPKTKVLQLLEAYPELEGLLIDAIPAFEKLKNPVLRKTVARITSLQQAASIGNIKVEDLINTLRQAVDQDLTAESAETHYVTEKPSWFAEGRIAMSLDARAMLAAGEHPVNQVMADLAPLGGGAIYKLTAPFLPAPLIDKATSLGMAHWVDQQGETLFDIYFCKTGETE